MLSQITQGREISLRMSTRQLFRTLGLAGLATGWIASAMAEQPLKDLVAFEPQRLELRRNPSDELMYVYVPAGRFLMGCSTGDGICRSWDHSGAQPTSIGKGFWIGQTEVTQAAYQRLMHLNPSKYQGPHLPVDGVNWQQASAYCAAAGLRLPTEAEWEYAARAGTDSPADLSGALGEFAWYAKNAQYQTHEVAQKSPNAWQLFDMLGNVWEWTVGKYPTNIAIRRGGSWGETRPYMSSIQYEACSDANSHPVNCSPDTAWYGFRCGGESLPVPAAIPNS